VEDRQTDGLLETYFAKLHGKPFYLLDEPVVRQRIQTGQLPGYLLMAIYAISSRQVCLAMSQTWLTSADFAVIKGYR
jgi:hypothetical protein